MKLTLYQYEISPFCDKVRRALRLKRLSWQTVEVLPSKGGAHKHISPTRKFPALDLDGRVVVDSTDILRELDRLQPAPPLYPKSPRDRALAVILEDWADESLYFYDLTMRNWPHNRALFVADLVQHETGLARALLPRVIPGALAKAAKSQGTGRKSEATVTADLTMLYGALDGLLDGQHWLAGPALSAADLAVRAMVNVLDRTTEGKAAHSALPALTAWSERVDAATL